MQRAFILTRATNKQTNLFMASVHVHRQNSMCILSLIYNFQAVAKGALSNCLLNCLSFTNDEESRTLSLLEKAVIYIYI